MHAINALHPAAAPDAGHPDHPDPRPSRPWPVLHFARPCPPHSLFSLAARLSALCPARVRAHKHRAQGTHPLRPPPRLASPPRARPTSLPSPTRRAQRAAAAAAGEEAQLYQRARVPRADDNTCLLRAPWLLRAASLGCSWCLGAGRGRCAPCKRARRASRRPALGASWAAPRRPPRPWAQPPAGPPAWQCPARASHT